LKTWNEYFERPVPLQLYVMHTGYIHMSGNIHFNKKDPRFKSMPKDKRFNPVFAFLVKHPDKGPLLLDTGLHPSFAERKSGNFGWFLGSMVKTKAEKGMDIASQLNTLNISLNDIGNIILSHLHLDHPCSLPLFKGIKDLRVHVDPKELDTARSAFCLFKGVIKSHLSGLDCHTMEYPLDIPPFAAVSDFFQDGSVFVVQTPGHTPGHISILLNAAEGPIFLTFDAAHRKPNIDQDLPPIGDYQTALDSVSRIKEMTKRFPKMRVIYGHDPDQFHDLNLVPNHYS
jgi:N-acyl homoserine lactone hydrolase